MTGYAADLYAIDQTEVNWHKAASGTLYFECHYATSTRAKSKSSLPPDQKVARVNGKWVITEADATSPELAP